MRRLLCWLFGHWWQPRLDTHDGTRRIRSRMCIRCGEYELAEEIDTELEAAIRRGIKDYNE